MIEFKVASVDSLIIYFSKIIHEESAKKVRFAYKALKNSNLDFLLDITPSYTSILVRFDIIKVDFYGAKEQIEKLLSSSKKEDEDEKSRLVEIPVYYDKEVGLDLEDVAKINDLSTKEVIKIHSQKEYLVFAIGFLAGFAYMGEVDKRIVTSRIANPRPKVPKGSVGIADNQTAVYPQQSPGGWRILGKTYIELFDLNFDGYSFLKVGDRVKYKPISKEEFLANGGEI